ncbi:MAG: hypothetical protein HN549_11390 [Proteobacteria bacterium]|nr:hypothetical protein [Pseudomonadota bacterium]
MSNSQTITQGGFTAIFLHELRMLFFAPLTYLFQGAFLLALGACIFLISSFYTTDEATVRLLLVFIPWVSLVLVPALAMSAWSDGHSNRELELVFALPIRPIYVVLGKFAAGYFLLLLTLAMTFPFCLTVAYLGEPDLGLVFSSYLGCALFLGTCFAVTLLSAAFLREPVGAFIAGLASLFILTLFGWDVFGRFLGSFVPQAAWEAITVYSPVTWLNVLGEGLIPTQGLVYFISSTVTALVLTHWVIAARRQGSIARLVSGFYFFALILLMLAWASAIFLAGQLTTQFDLTAEKEFTLHSGSREILQQMPDGATVTLYWSSSEESVPASIKSHARRIDRLIAQMAKISSLKLVTVDPKPDTEAELKALVRRIHRVPMSSGDHFFLGLTVEANDRIGHISYLDVRRASFLEYDIVQALNGLNQERTPRVAVISPLLPSSAALAEKEGLSFMAELKRAYDIAVIPFFKKSLPEGIDTLILLGADVLHEEMLYSIDQFVMRGGSLIVMIDPFTRVKPANNAINPSPSKSINDISDLLARYGVSYVGDQIVGDAQFASVVGDGGEGRLNYPYWLRVGQTGLSTEHPTTANLNELLMVEPGSFTFSPDVEVITLIRTTDQANTFPTENFEQQSPSQLALGFKAGETAKVISAAVHGPLKSAYSESLTEATESHISSSEGSPIIFVVADIDWLFDPFSLQKTTLGDEIAVRPLNDNISFLLNMIEYATGADALLEIRSRGQLQRPFTRVADLFRNAQQKLQEQEATLSSKVTALEQQLGAINQQTQDLEFADLPESIKLKLQEFQDELLSARRDLRAVRHEIRSEVEALGRRLTLINLAAGPAQILFLALIVMMWRTYRSRARVRP